jgi:signal transduction histidine kinase
MTPGIAKIDLVKSGQGEPNRVMDSFSVQQGDKRNSSCEEGRYRALFENAPVAIWEEDFSQIKLVIDELKSSGIADLRAYFLERPDRLMECVRRIRVLDVNRRAMEFYDASTKEQVISSLPELFDESALAIFREELVTLAAGNPEFESEVNALTLTGARKVVEMKVMVLSTPNDDWSKVVISFVDVTERKRIEQRSLELQKLESIGRLAGGIAHEFNNLLTVINGYSDLLLARLQDAGDIRADIQHIKDAGDEAAALVRQLLAFSRKQALKPRVLDVSQVIREIQATLEPAIGEDIEIAAELSPDLLCVQADPAQIQQVIFNLAANARDAMPRGGRLTIRTENTIVTGSQVEQLTALRPGRHVLITVTDTGTGMNEETAGHLFEPFFTTKDIGKGTGLGLASVFGIVRQSGGDIAVTTRIGQGSTFRIYLPAVERGNGEPLPAVAAQ